MESQIIPGASHPKTNEIVYRLITRHISDESIVLDFGAGQGHMSQRVGEYFRNLGREPKKHIYACEIAPEQFKYKSIECEKIYTDSRIPFRDNTFDLIYAIEVLEHTPRPYDFFLQAFAKLKEGGVLIFSTPNILHFKSRLSFLLTGYAETYGPLSIKEKNAGRMCGHIMPLSYSNFHYGLRKSGFDSIEFYVDRRKKGALVLALLIYPILKYSSYRAGKNLKRYDEEVFRENQGVVSNMNSINVLSSRSCILVAKKPKT